MLAIGYHLLLLSMLIEIFNYFNVVVELLMQYVY
jgi:hypothetical protein